jgi:hypothetical protein
MGMNVSIFIMDENINWIYMFLIYKTSIKIMDECFILSLNSYQFYII